MDKESLASVISDILCSAAAKRLSASYHTDPMDAMGYIYLHLEKSNAHTNPDVWLRKSVIGHLRNFLRSECTTNKIVSKPIPAKFHRVCETECAEAQLERDELDLVIHKKLDCLDKFAHEAFEAYQKISDLSCRAVATKHGVSVQTACNWARRTQKQLQEWLEGKI